MPQDRLVSPVSSLPDSSDKSSSEGEAEDLSEEDEVQDRRPTSPAPSFPDPSDLSCSEEKAEDADPAAFPSRLSDEAFQARIERRSCDEPEDPGTSTL